MGASSSPRRRSAARKILLSAIAVTGSLTAAYVVQAVSGWVAATPATVHAAPLAGTAALSGTVDSTMPFKAAQVFIRNVDKRMLYTCTRRGPVPSGESVSRQLRDQRRHQGTPIRRSRSWS